VRVARFDAMGCAIAVGGATPRELQAVVGLFRQRDNVFSRLREGSELNEVNEAAGSVVGVSPLFARAIGAALAAARATGGLVDPTPGRWNEVRLLGRLVLVPAGVPLDLDRVARAAAVDDALELLSGDGFVSAVGDVAARGNVPIQVPGGATISVAGGGIATATGERKGSPWTQVTVTAASCLDAVTPARAAVLLGADGPAWLSERGIPGRFVAPDGSVLANQAWHAQLDRAAA
jgi:thiamine biosynthesis lipoprotein